MPLPRLLSALCAALLAAPATAAAQPEDTPPDHPIWNSVIADGVRAGGLPVGGLTVFAASQRIDAAFRGRLERNVVVRVGGRRHRMRAADAGFVFDHVRTAKRAYYAGRTDPAAEVPLALGHSVAAVRAFTRSVDRKVSRPARDARLRVTLRRMVITRARHGRSIDERALERSISRALADRRASRIFRARLHRVRPRTTVARLRRLNGTVLTVDRAARKLRLFKGLRWRKTYGIAIGAAGFETPRGLFRIRSKQVNPAWHAPNRPWAGAYAGRTIPGGAPNNPLKARWLGIAGGVGIHGTAEEWSIGTRASHGCIRMRVRDVIDLYRRVPVGARVLIR